MKSLRLLFTLLAVFLCFSSSAGILVLEGTYQGKNLFVKNSFGSEGVGFCIYEVTINGKLNPDEVNQSAFEIDFGFQNIKMGEAVIIKIKHKDDCNIKVLNPEVLKPKSTFETENVKLGQDGIFHWTTSNETAQLNYIVEQFRWNKWVKVGEVKGKGTSGIHKYEFKITPHSGENKIRVKQLDYTSKPRYSDAATMVSEQEPVSISGDKFKNQISFVGGKSQYELYDKYGTIVKRGYSDNINISNLDKGTYYLSLDNKTETIKIR